MNNSHQTPQEVLSLLISSYPTMTCIAARSMNRASSGATTRSYSGSLKICRCYVNGPQAEDGRRTDREEILQRLTVKRRSAVKWNYGRELSQDGRSCGVNMVLKDGRPQRPS